MKISSVQKTGIQLLRLHFQSSGIFEGTFSYKLIFQTVNTTLHAVRIRLYVSTKIISHYRPNYRNKKEDFTNVFQV
jgi:hypothetical protein